MHYLVLCRKNKMLIYHGKKSVLCAELQNAAAKISTSKFPDRNSHKVLKSQAENILSFGKLQPH